MPVNNPSSNPTYQSFLQIHFNRSRYPFLIPALIVSLLAVPSSSSIPDLQAGDPHVAMTKEEKKEKKEEKKELIEAVYKVNLHCLKCAQDIRKPLLRTPGVHSVDAKYEKNEVTLKGFIETKNIQQRLQKWSKKKVEIISETKSKVEEKKEKEKKETIKTIKIKAYMHCEECERVVKKRLLKHKGIYNVKTDIKAQTITTEGVIEEDKLITYMRKRVHKYAEIIKEKKDEKKEKEKFEVKVTEKVFEFKEVDKVQGTKNKDGEIPYFVHYAYAPQLFSDENPNACSVM